MRKEIVDRLEKELADWRTRLDGLRVKASLGKMELRDRERVLLDGFQPAYEKAMEKLGEAKDFAGSEAKAVKAGLEAGWKELRKTYESVRGPDKDS